jgi:hypothetical protein
LGERTPPDDYAQWLRTGAPRQWLFDVYSQVIAHRRQQEPQWAAEQMVIDALAEVYATGEMDPLIGARMQSGLSTGEKSVFIIDGRHRLYAAIAGGIPELEVYIGRAAPGVRR